MGSQMIQILVLAGIALFLVLRLRNVLGTRDGFEPTQQAEISRPNGKAPPERDFEVIEGGGIDRDIEDHAEPDSDTGRALLGMKRDEPGFAVGDFVHGSKSAYEMILMAFENGDLATLEQFLAPEVFNSFSQAVQERADKGLSIEATFVGVRETKLMEARYDPETNEGEITMRFIGELTSVVRDNAGDIIEGDAKEIKRQRDIWTFARLMGTDNPNWLLVATEA